MKARATATIAAALTALVVGSIALGLGGGAHAAGAGGAVSASGDSSAGAVRARASVSPPPSNPWPIPFGPKRKREMAAYSERHYGQYRWRLRKPRVIVQHMAQIGTAAGVRNVFVPDHPDPELGELPNVCSHYVISPSGRIFRLVNLRTRCRHTVGLNWTAIGIEHAGYGDGDLMGNPRQLRASLRLTRYLRCRFAIGVSDVIGHAESLRSPYHRERVPSLRSQTHGDMRPAAMRVYRAKLREQGC
jgi:N-acetylmuramoyl-L-alanine amidase